MRFIFICFVSIQLKKSKIFDLVQIQKIIQKFLTNPTQNFDKIFIQLEKVGKGIEQG